VRVRWPAVALLGHPRRSSATRPPSSDLCTPTAILYSPRVSGNEYAQIMKSPTPNTMTAVLASAGSNPYRIDTR
jgi:hypothetical protein